MADSVPTPTEGSSESRPYRRSWKNLLINKRYQLRFTLFMVGLSAALMMLLGIWVKRVADNTTEVGLARVRGELCPPLPTDGGAGEAVDSPVMSPAPGSPSAPGGAAAHPAAAPTVPSVVPGAVDPSGNAAADPAVPSEISDPSGSGLGADVAASATGDDPAAAGSGDGEEDRPRSRVLIDESSMTLTPTPRASAADVAAARTANRECEQRQAGLIEDLEQRRRNIGWVLLASGLLLCAGLAMYGIKMTHRVAGPLHKVGLYLTKMRGGRYDTVYPLRKGDELMEFYEHFKAAHAGVVAAETSDVTRMRAVVEKSGSGPHDPQLTKALADLQVAIERKEKALE